MSVASSTLQHCGTVALQPPRRVWSSTTPCMQVVMLSLICRSGAVIWSRASCWSVWKWKRVGVQTSDWTCRIHRITIKYSLYTQSISEHLTHRPVIPSTLVTSDKHRRANSPRVEYCHPGHSSSSTDTVYCPLPIGYSGSFSMIYDVIIVVVRNDVI